MTRRAWFGALFGSAIAAGAQRVCAGVTDSDIVPTRLEGLEPVRVLYDPRSERMHFFYASEAPGDEHVYSIDTMRPQP